MTSRPSRRRVTLGLAGLAAMLAISVPVLAAQPSAVPDAPGQERKPDKANKPEKGPELEQTLTGTVEQTSDEKGRPTYTITVDGVMWELSAGPRWFWGENNPLAASVGKSVEVKGTHHEGETELDVDTVDGQALREPGRPPWAGGPKVVGERHPGWKPWKAEGKPGNGIGREGAPGQQKDHAPEPSEDTGG